MISGEQSQKGHQWNQCGTGCAEVPIETQKSRKHIVSATHAERATYDKERFHDFEHPSLLKKSQRNLFVILNAGKTSECE